MCGPKPKNSLERQSLVGKLLLVVEKEYQCTLKVLAKEKHLSDVEFVNQNGRGK